MEFQLEQSAKIRSHVLSMYKNSDITMRLWLNVWFRTLELKAIKSME